MLPGRRPAQGNGASARYQRHPLGVAWVGLVAVTVVAAACSGTPLENPETGPFAAVAAGGDHVCGLKIDSTIACWGNNASGQVDVPDGEFLAIAVGGEHSCALGTDGTVVCWGSNRWGQTRSPVGEFSAVATGGEHSCALRTDDRVVCWGSQRLLQRDSPLGRFSQIAAGGRHSCAVRSPDQTVVCWGDDYYGQADAPDGRFWAVHAGESHSCGLRANRTISCWGNNTYGQSQAPPGKFDAVAAGELHTCGLRIDGTISCWGDNTYGQSEEPEEDFTALSVGRRHSCGVRTGGIINCWGDLSDDRTAGDKYSCGLRVDGTIACWGIELTPVPAGARHLALGGRPDRANCRPHGVPENATAGFPLPVQALEADGRLRVAVLFVDFPDAPADYSVSQEIELGLPFMEEALESSSYLSLDIEFVPLDRWLRAEHSVDHYLEDSGAHRLVSSDIEAEAVRLADPHFDFDGIDALIVVMPSAHLTGGVAQGWVETDEGRVAHTLRVNASPHDVVGGPFPWGWLVTHEFLHLLGLVDMYPLDRVEPTAPPDGQAWIYGGFGFMSLHALYLAPTTNLPLTFEFEGPDGSSLTEGFLGSTASEMLAWSRWQLGWLAYDQILCLRDDQMSFELAPVAEPGDGIAMAAIPLSDDEVIVLEGRRQMGFDLAYEQHLPDGGRLVQPALLNEGVLVYTVDASVSTGDMPIRLLDDTGDQVVDVYPILGVGESATVRGYTIAVIADDGDTHTVTIAKTGDG